MSQTRLAARTWIAVVVAGLLAPLNGCISSDDLEDLFDEIQDIDPRLIILPAGVTNEGDTIIINQDVQIITEVDQQITREELPDLTLLAFENDSGFDLYVRYLVEGDEQAVFVFDGETLLLDYPCVTDVELIRQDEFDPDTGILIDGFDLTDGLFLQDVDYICGDTLIFNFDDSGVDATVRPVGL